MGAIGSHTQITPSMPTLPSFARAGTPFVRSNLKVEEPNSSHPPRCSQAAAVSASSEGRHCFEWARSEQSAAATVTVGAPPDANVLSSLCNTRSDECRWLHVPWISGQQPAVRVRCWMVGKFCVTNRRIRAAEREVAPYRYNGNRSESFFRHLAVGGGGEEQCGRTWRRRAYAASSSSRFLLL